MKELLTQFFEALDEALTLDKTETPWTSKTVGSVQDRMFAWSGVWRLRRELMSTESERNSTLEEAAQHLEKIKTGATIDIVVQSFADEVRKLKGE